MPRSLSDPLLREVMNGNDGPLELGVDLKHVLGVFFHQAFLLLGAASLKLVLAQKGFAEHLFL